MRIPTATYRIQFTSDFDFKAAQSVIAYLSRLGISHLYASPIFKAIKGSRHGYDVVDPNVVNPELGGDKGFYELIKQVKNHGMFWLQDIVPNHMAFDSENAMLMDVLENGEYSPYYNFFDIEWNHIYESIRGRLLAPFLGRFYSESLEDGEITLRYDENGFSINHYDLKLPLQIKSYAQILNHNLQGLEDRLEKNHPHLIKFMGIVYTLSSLPGPDKAEEYYKQIELAKKMLWDLCKESEEIKAYLNETIAQFNGERGRPESFNLLDNLLAQELFRLSFWKVANEEINYRRFFSINKLISLKMEDETVFNQAHKLIFEMLEAGHFDGLRVDHIDGLYDPENYIKALRQKALDSYLVIEKILEPKEFLPSSWPVHGTTGYDFSNYVNGLFCDHRSERKFNRIYFKFTGFKKLYDNLLDENKRFIIGKHMAGDIDNLAHIIKRVSSLGRYGRDITLYGLRRALVEIMASFPVYRTYIRSAAISKKDIIYIKEAVNKARKRNPELTYELNFVEKFLLMEFVALLTQEEKGLMLNFVMRWQQFTGPLMAKGVEDTFFYVYNRLISLNDVGGDPGKFGITIKEFHQFNKKRIASFANSMNATETHDSKRGEDVRARINVISEIPKEWETHIRKLKKLNRSKKAKLNGIYAPDDNDEYFLYQTLLGAWPLDEKEYEQFSLRMKEYVIKAVREAKVHTAWIKPDNDYENAYVSFVESIMKDTVFKEEFMSFLKRVAHFGILNSLSQTLIKITASGVPDFYQGCELWDLSLVDPDNRRPVDFGKRKTILKYFEEKQKDILNLVKELIASREDGRIKFFLIFRALQTRRLKEDLFRLGGYVPLEVGGKLKNKIIAFARHHNNEWILTVAPRFLTSIIKDGELPLGSEVWGDTHIIMHENMPKDWKDVLTENRVISDNQFEIGKILTHFPAALLISGF